MTKNELLKGMGTLYEPEPNSGCWLWTGGRAWNGYGLVWLNGKTKRAHREMHKMSNGPIPSGMCVLHSCDTPACVNPAHLHVGSLQDNSSEMIDRGRSTRGEVDPNSKLTESDVRDIRKRLLSGEHQGDIGDRYGVSATAICHIKTGYRWGWLQ